jgi:hypothetical protein
MLVKEVFEKVTKIQKLGTAALLAVQTFPLIPG